MAKCKTCDLKIDGRSKNNVGVLCSHCNEYFHQKCVNVSSKIIEDIKNLKINWKCDSCKIITQEKSLIYSDVDESEDDDLESVNKAIENIMKDMNNLRKQQNDINASLKAVSNGIENVKKIFKIVEEHKEKFRSLEKENKELKGEIALLRMKVEDLEYKSSTKFVEIANIPENIETDSKGKQNLSKIVSKVHQALNISINDDDIIKVYRKSSIKYKATNPTKPKPIIVKYNSEAMRDKVIAQSHYSRYITLDKLTDNTSDEQHKIYVNEFLTNAKKQLLYETKQFKKENNCKYVWVRNGRIYLKYDDNSKVFIVKNRSSFDGITMKIKNLCNQDK